MNMEPDERETFGYKSKSSLVHGTLLHTNREHYVLWYIMISVHSGKFN